MYCNVTGIPLQVYNRFDKIVHFQADLSIQTEVERTSLFDMPLITLIYISDFASVNLVNQHDCKNVNHKADAQYCSHDIL